MKIRYCLLSLMFFVSACTTIPVTGRSQLLFSSEAEEAAQGAEAYSQYLAESKISSDAKNTALVKKVGQKIAAVSECNYDWQFNLLENNEANAWCLPGGKVAVYTGILPFTQTEAGLATVMAHEIAHAIARHGASKSTQATLLQGGMTILNAKLGNDDTAKKNAIMQGATILGNVGYILPYSRKFESEADYIGLILMAKAGYNPEEAISFWQRMAQANSGSQNVISNFLSTHPSDEKRVEDLRRHLPEAMEYYNKTKK